MAGAGGAGDRYGSLACAPLPCLQAVSVAAPIAMGAFIGIKLAPETSGSWYK